MQSNFIVIDNTVLQHGVLFDPLFPDQINADLLANDNLQNIDLQEHWLVKRHLLVFTLLDL